MANDVRRKVGASDHISPGNISKPRRFITAFHEPWSRSVVHKQMIQLLQTVVSGAGRVFYLSTFLEPRRWESRFGVPALAGLGRGRLKPGLRTQKPMGERFMAPTRVQTWRSKLPTASEDAPRSHERSHGQQMRRPASGSTSVSWLDEVAGVVLRTLLGSRNGLGSPFYPKTEVGQTGMSASRSTSVSGFNPRTLPRHLWRKLIFQIVPGKTNPGVRELRDLFSGNASREAC